MNIARVAAVALLCLSSSGLFAAPKPADEAAAEKRITATLHRMYRAEKRRDLMFVLSHLADDFAEVAGDGGVYHRADIEAGWADVVLNDYRLSGCVFKLMTRDAAYLSCKMDVDATYKGQPFPEHLRVTTVWTRRKGKWLLRFEQGTVIPESANRNSPAQQAAP
jgi:ketosteroid isomerase-like protein